MKTVYLIPTTEVAPVGTYSLLQSVSGPGFEDKGEASQETKPRAPKF